MKKYIAIFIVLLNMSACQQSGQKPLTVVHLCDPQLGFGGFAADSARFEQAIRQVNELSPDMVVIAGDMVHDINDGHAVATVRRQIDRLKPPVILTPGNHDIPEPVTPERLERYRRLFGDDFKAVECKGRMIVSANSQLWRDAPAEETERNDRQLSEALQKAKKNGMPVILVTHIPPFVTDIDEKDDYNNISVTERNKLLEQLEQNGAVIWLSGHLHRTVNRRYGKITVLNGETTSVNFDKRPYGFRLLRIYPDGLHDWIFIPLNNMQ
ncbi:MAG: metallophosphoesterase [Prevotellaceae bacterium]|jgi:3',5'-cyclic AMP phosphodiesterase CpdA|nr:metallophosphoesterase [Prevotellaceae bacterium]